MSLKIRKAELSDIPEMVRVHTDTWKQAYRGYVSDDLLNNPRFMASDEQCARMKIPVQNGWTFVAEQNGEIVGLSQINTTEIPPEIKLLYIRPDCQRQGIGRALFEYVLNELAHRGYPTAYLWALQNYPPATHFYTRMGGHTTGKSQRMKFGFEVIQFVFDLSERQ